jgi:CRISPR-associated protein Csb2
MLTLEIELLTGVYRAALHDGSGAEWPPHPERVFSALAQAWGDGGCDSQEGAALKWLERQGAPWIKADHREEWAERNAPTVFVPPNDDRGNEISVLPERRRRQARVFRAAVPATAIVRMGWDRARARHCEHGLDRVAALGQCHAPGLDSGRVRCADDAAAMSGCVELHGDRSARSPARRAHG